jgi:membrane-associated phospholipid phosphatase
MATQFLLMANELSLLVFLYTAVPFIVLLVRPSSQHILWFTAVLSAPFTAELIKRGSHMLGLPEWCRRPSGASNCDSWNRNGPQAGAPGFPSGHTATTTAFWVGAVLLTPRPLQPLFFFACLIATGTMIWARMYKRCHTFVQTIGGGLLGALVSWTLLWNAKN